jgi:hypothetical protein
MMFGMPRLLLLTLLTGAMVHSGCRNGEECTSSRSAAPDSRTALVGRVTSSVGQPVAGARVAIYPPGSERARAVVVTERDGRFAAVVDKGRYALTATAVGHSAAFFAEHDFGDDSGAVELIDCSR